MTFHSQVTILLVQRQTFHSQSNSTRERLGVSNRKGCFGSPNWFFYASLLRDSLKVEIPLNTHDLSLSSDDLALSTGDLARSKPNLSLKIDFYARKPRSFQQKRLHLQPQLVLLRFASEGNLGKWRFH